jgi:Flp pilus assembly protein TadD
MWTRNPILRSRTVLFGLFLCTLVAVAAQQPPVPEDYIVVVLKGTARITRAGTQIVELVTTNQVVRIGDRVKVGPQSQLALRKGHLQVHRFDENAEFEIEPPRAPEGPKTRLNLFSGIYNFFHRDKPTDLEVRTQSRSAACRGTEFNVQVDPDGTMTVTVIDGIVDLIDPQAPAPLTLTNGQQGVMGPGRPPTRSPAIDTVSIIQWTFYYPGVLDTRELPFSDAERATLNASIASYESGDILAAVASYPAGRAPQSDAERIYSAALLLAVGQVDDAQPLLSAVNRAAGDTNSRLAAALEQMIAVVKQRAGPPALPPQLGTEWMVESYRLQFLTRLDEALAAARQATEKSPVFGFAWERVAELEFSHGRRDESTRALQSALDFSPRNAQAVALNGFLLAARNSIRAAIAEFDRAIAIDSGLPNAWLGRGLCRIRLNDLDSGRDDLLVAAALEPQRGFLRSYLGKAWADSGKLKLAEHELELAKTLDKNDPTAWLYSALLKQQQNKINDAIRELEHAQDLGTNRAIYRSEFLLDQDRAVRSANLAHVYRDAGMTEWSVLEAGRAVSADYANYSAHLFLANSYDELRDPNRFNLRYEIPAESEYLIANLLAPVGAGPLSQSISQGEYSKLFERNRPGLVSSTEYLSRGAWVQNNAQFGTFGNTGYSLESLYRSDPSQHPNNDSEALELRLHLKQQITPDDSIYIRAEFLHTEAGDVAQYYDPSQASSFLRTKQDEPWVHLGYNHQWRPGVNTLFLAGHLADRFSLHNPFQPSYLYSGELIAPIEVVDQFAANLQYKGDLDIYTTEIQQTFQHKNHQMIVGTRYQNGEFRTRNFQSDPVFFGNLGPGLFENDIIADQDIHSHFERFGLYAYDYWRPIPAIQLIGGFAYERISFPRNFLAPPPISDAQGYDEQVSPKAGIIWTPRKNTSLRFAYTQSLSGASVDQDIQLEPSQVAGLNQSFRNLIPESVLSGISPGTTFETFTFGLDNKFETGTYISLFGQILQSSGVREVGAFGINSEIEFFAHPAVTSESFDYRERNLALVVNQLLGYGWSVAASYRVSDANLGFRFTEIPDEAFLLHGVQAKGDQTSVLHRAGLDTIYNHPSGFFIDLQGYWYQQSNQGYSPKLDGSGFWQFNSFIGYRFPRRRAELRLGLLNLTDQDYRLSPLNLYNELPRERTFALRFRFDL